MASLKFDTDNDATNSGPSRRRSKLLKTPFIGAIIVFVLVAVGFGYWMFPTHNEHSVCNTNECRDTASVVLSKINPQINPCDNFYDFSCGTYVDKMIIPEDKTHINRLTDIADKVHEQLKDIITAEPPESAPKHFRQPNMLYKACMNTTRIESLGSIPITTIANSMGGWPLIVGDKWDEDNWTWQDQIKKFHRGGFNMNYIIKFSIKVDLQNTTKRIMTVSSAIKLQLNLIVLCSLVGCIEFVLSREYLVRGFNETLVSAYYDYMVDIAVLFGAKKDEAKKQLLQSLEFEIALANISWPIEKRHNHSELYNLRTPQQLQAEYPYVDWVDYMNALLPEGLSVQDDEIINLIEPPFFDQLGKLLARTPNRVIANYLMWRIHEFSLSYLSEEFHTRKQKYIMILAGHQEQRARWKECVYIVSKILSKSVALMYVPKHFDENSKSNVLEMVNNIRNVFNEILDEVNWMDDKTRLEAKNKLHKMATNIGYPDELLDNEKLNKYYEKLEIDPNNYFKSYLAFNIFQTNCIFNRLRLPVNKTNLANHAKTTEVDASYSAEGNSIYIPAGILQGDFYNANRPNYMNFGAIGYIIGHEISHGFDVDGRQFDEEGNMRDWWQPDTQKAYLKKAQCIIEQYGNYTEPKTGLKLNGINTQSENIADNVGIKMAYRAYKRWVEKHGEEQRLPGLDYTPQQMFWISVAHTWCTKYRKEYLDLWIKTDEHSPSEFRILGPLSNSKEFSKDFQCPEGSPMNPVHKCEVW
ncbi:neprilysin-2-like [Drosophila sulfurigaster albostrigata]|uniref:neprilysin-2-like n=1 Tax=Drosophila sulfurigaster albostrigata TaxID=89887 RepID=UPI002D21AD68|nr:neprilysin-2-like [Drosophila sulfurigaster albostrigata]